jgi:crotonobetainyl-CoA:carnitine CoA-transferase CaiB-like acyl-CoA transferase
MAGILDGIKVIEMGHVVAVPAASAMLADWGAEVIKVEALAGELIRGLLRTHGKKRVIQFDNGQMNWTFELLNRNKKSLAINLKTEEGKEALYKLVGGADVFISNFELGALKKLKVDYATLRQYNPGLVYGVLTGYGTVGPDKDERGFDYAAAWARSGAQYLMAEKGSPPPPQRSGMMDRVVGAHIVGAVLAALLHRGKTGEGQELEFSLYHSGVWTIAEDIQSALVGETLPGNDRTEAASPIWNTYRTRDNRWFQLVMLQADLQWPGFCRAIGMPELEKDVRFNTMEAREQNCRELIHILDEVFASGAAEEWEKSFREHDCIYGRVATPGEVISDPQALANGFFAEVQHSAAGKMRVVTTPVKFRQNPAAVKGPAPELGQDTEEILLDLGYSWEDIAQLKEQSVIL